MKEYLIDEYFEFTFNTQNPTTGVATDADATPTYRVYEENNDTVIDSGDCTKRDDGNTTGYYYVRGQCTTALGYEAGKSYEVRCAATVGGVAGAAVVGRFLIVAQDADTTLGRIYDDTNTMEATTLPAIKAKTDTIPTLPAATGADGDTLETLSDQLDLIGATAGEVEWAYTVRVNGTVQAGALVMLYSDAAYTSLIQQGYTLASGLVTFHITSAQNAATKYLKTYAPGWSVQYDTETP